MCIPVWDTRIPSVQQINDGIEWALKVLYIHGSTAPPERNKYFMVKICNRPPLNLYFTVLHCNRPPHVETSRRMTGATGAGGAGAGGLGSAGKMSAGVTGHLSLALLKNVKFRYRPTNAPFRNKYILPQRPVTAPIQNND